MMNQNNVVLTNSKKITQLEFRFKDKLRTLRRASERVAIKQYEVTEERKRYSHKERLSTRNSDKKSKKLYRKKIRDCIAKMQAMNLHTESLTDLGIDFVIDTLLAPLNEHKEMIQYISSCLILLYQCVRARNAFDVAAAGTQFWIALGNNRTNARYYVTPLVTVAMTLGHQNGYNEAIFLAASNEICFNESHWDECHTESISDKMVQAKNWLTCVLKGEAASSIRNIFLSAVSCKIFEKDFAKNAQAILGKLPAMTALELISYVWDQLVSLMRFGENWIASKSFLSAITAGDPVQSCMAASDQLLYYKDKLSVGLPVSGYKDCKEFINEVAQLVQLFDKVLTRSSPLADLRSVRLRKLDLEQARFDAINLMNASTRPVPMGVIAHGHPGVGKSVILDHICDLWSTTMNRKFEKSHVYSRTMTSQYWERYQPFSQPVIHYSEIGNITSKMAATKVDDVIKELTSLVDSLPFPTDQASVDTKGKVFAHPELVIADTNNPSLNLSSMFVNPTAYQRRFIYVEMKVKPQYRMRGGSGIDPVAASLSQDPSMDRWLFTVTKYIPNGNSVSSVNYLLNDGDIYAFTQVMKTVFLAHIASQQRIKLVQNTNSSFYANPIPTSQQNIASYVERCKSAYDKTSFARARTLFDVHFAIHDVSLKDQVWEAYRQWRNSQGIETQGLIEKIKNRKKKSSPTVFEQEEKDEIAAIHEESDSYEVASNYSESLNTQFTLQERFYFFRTDIRYWWVTKSSRTFDVVTSLPRIIWNIWWWLIFIAGLAVCIWFGEKGWGTEYFVKMGLDALRKKKAQIWANIKDQVSEKIVNPFETDWWKSYGPGATLFTLGLTMAFTGMKIFARYEKSPKSESQVIEETEKEILAGTSYSRQPIKNMAVWNSREQVQVPGVFRGAASELYPSIAKNIRRVRVETDDNITCFLLGVAGQYAVINTHSLGTLPSPLLRVSYTGITSIENKIFKDTRLSSDNRWDLGNDVTLVKLTDITFRDILKHISDQSQTGNMSGYFRDSTVSIFNETVARTLKDPIIGDVHVKNLLAYKYADHKRGLCGMPVLTGDTQICIAGIHVAGSGDMGFSVPLSRSSIMRAIEADKSFLLPLASQGEILCESALTDAHPKSPFAHEFLPGINYLGRLNVGVSPNQKSRLRKTPLFEGVPKIFEKYNMPQTTFFGKPMMKPSVINGEFISPWNKTLNQMSTQRPTLDRKILERITNELTDKFVSFLKNKDIKLSPLTMDSAIRGAESDPFIRKINLSTAAGFGLKGKKKDHIREEGLSPELQEMVEKILSNYKEGKSCSPVYEACLKDEPREESKIKIGKTRVFYSGSTAGLIVSRMLLSPFYSLMVEYNDLFSTTVGINTHRAGELIAKMNEFSRICMAGDYKFFDINMPFEIGHVVATIIWNVCKALGYNETALIMLRACLSDNLTPMINMLGDLFKLPGLQPSGKYATAEDNSLRNLVMLMYGWYMHSAEDFFKYNDPKTYGDDLINAIKECVTSYWNNQVYQVVCRDVFRMGYTSPDKKDVIEKYTNTLDAEFLKRKFVYREDISNWVMPLDPNSLMRALQWVMPSSAVSEREQMHGALNSVMWELAFHLSRDAHEHICLELTALFNKEYDNISPAPPLQFDRIIGAVFEDEKFEFPGDDRAGKVNRSDDMIVLESCVEHVNGIAYQSKAVSGESAPLNRYPIHLEAGSARCQDFDNKICAKTLKELRSMCSIELQKVEESISALESLNLPSTHLKLTRYIQNISNAAYLEEARNKMVLLALRESLQHTIQYIDYAEAIQELALDTESALADSSDGSVSQIRQEQNVVDTAGGEFWMVDAGVSSVSQSPGTLGELSLSDFLKRPVEIYSGQISTITNLALDVWDLYTRSPPVRAKLRNYAFLRANLHVRVVISGTPFDYGNVMVSYQPLAYYNATLASHKLQLLASAGWRPLFLNYLSQERSTAILSVCENSPLEIKCPYILPKPVARLFSYSSSAIGSSDSYPDFNAMGQLIVLAMGNIGATSTGGNAPRIQVYAWMEDVEISGATGTVSVITTESGKADERVTGPIETVSSHAQRVSDILSQVPMIGPYAKASSIAFGAMKSIAAIFGWSKPLVPEDPTFMRPEPFVNGALTIGRDNCMKIVLDPHQELTVDPRIVGSEQDEMSISYLANKMSYFHTFNWETSDVPMTTVLFGARNTPFLDTRGTFGTANIVQPTALKHAAMPFAFWRGDMVYRFKIANNNFFRGKIAVIFEPNPYQETLITATTSLNKQYMKIIDIQDTNTFDVCVNWANDREWLFGCPPNISNVYPWGLYNQMVNGFIYVVPFTTLQSPNGDPLDIHVFVGGKNMCFNQLTHENMYSTRSTGIPGLRDEEDELKTESAAADVAVAQPVSCMELNESNMSMNHIRENYFGEQPLSFRALMKRYVFNRKLDVGATTGSNRHAVYTARIYPDNMVPYGSGSVYEIDLYSHLKYAYLGMRGSVRHRFFWNNPAANVPNFTTKVTLLEPNGGSNFTPGLTFGTGVPKSSLNGSVTYIPSSNNAIDFEIPFYSGNLFLIAFSDIDSIAQGVLQEYYSRYYQVQIQVGDVAVSEITEEFAFGEDFTFLRYQGAPYYSYT